MTTATITIIISIITITITTIVNQHVLRGRGHPAGGREAARLRRPRLHVEPEVQYNNS